MNGGPTGIPTNGVNITNISMLNVRGTAQPGAMDYYILTANETSAATWVFSDVDVTGGGSSACVVVPSGFSC